METKACSKCKEVKLFSEFQKDKSKASGLKSQCKACRSIITTSSVGSKAGTGKVGRPRKYPPPIPKPNLKYKSKSEKRRLQTAYTRAKNKRKQDIKSIKQKERELAKPYLGFATLEEMYGSLDTLRMERWRAFKTLKKSEKIQCVLAPIRIYLGARWKGGHLEPTPKEDVAIRIYNQIKCEIDACEFLKAGKVLEAFNIFRKTHGVYPPDYILNHFVPERIYEQRRNRKDALRGRAEPMKLTPIEIACRYTLPDLPSEPEPVIDKDRPSYQFMLRNEKREDSPELKAYHERKARERAALMKAYAAKRANNIEDIT